MEEIKNIKMILAYDGTGYHGWQRQKNDRTIQAVLEEKVGIITNRKVNIIGSGRTDAGVHALHQVCNFHTDSIIDPESLRQGLNSLLPDDIFIKSAEYTGPEFHSRYSVISKIYEYRVLNSRDRDLFLRNYTWHIRDPLNLEEMEKCLNMLIGNHDFSAFRSTGSVNVNPVRNMIRTGIRDQDDGLILFSFEAEGFLRHMVRNIMGTLMEVGRGKISCPDFESILRSKDRQKAGIKSPPQGLFLIMVNY